VEATAGLHRGADHDELRAALSGDARDVLAKLPRPRADDFSPHVDAVRSRHRRRGLEPLLESAELTVEMRVEGQLALDDEGCHKHDPRPAIGGEPAGEIECVLGLLALEQRDDDAAVGDRLRPQREAPRSAPERPEVRQPHRRSW
jgi:hypothetical protein